MIHLAFNFFYPQMFRYQLLPPNSPSSRLCIKFFFFYQTKPYWPGQFQIVLLLLLLIENWTGNLLIILIIELLLFCVKRSFSSSSSFYSPTIIIRRRTNVSIFWFPFNSLRRCNTRNRVSWIKLNCNTWIWPPIQQIPLLSSPLAIDWRRTDIHWSTISFRPPLTAWPRVHPPQSARSSSGQPERSLVMSTRDARGHEY